MSSILYYAREVCEAHINFLHLQLAIVSIKYFCVKSGETKFANIVTDLFTSFFILFTVFLLLPIRRTNLCIIGQVTVTVR